MSRKTADLSPATRWLVHRMDEIYYGTMYNIRIKNGEPVTNPPPKVREEFRAGKRRVSRVGAHAIVLKPQHYHLLEVIQEKQNGIIPVLKVQEGFPFFFEWEDA